MQISDPGGTLIGNIKYWEIAIREGWHWQVNGGREMADADYKDFTFEQIAEAFEYDPEEGLLWRRRPDGVLTEVSLVYESNARGLKTASAQLLGQPLTVTHIMFMLMERRWPRPGKVMDHRDGRRDNCKWSNLRESTQRQSNMNRRGWANEEGLERGVYRHRNRYRVSFTIHGQCKSFGYYVSKDDANALARSIRESIQGEYSAEASRPPNHDYSMFGG